MDKDLITNPHLLRLSIDDDDINRESDSDIQANDTGQINDNFVRVNLSNNEYSSEDELENLTDSDNNKEIICLKQSSTSSALKTVTVTAQHEQLSLKDMRKN